MWQKIRTTTAAATEAVTTSEMKEEKEDQWMVIEWIKRSCGVDDCNWIIRKHTGESIHLLKSEHQEQKDEDGEREKNKRRAAGGKRKKKVATKNEKKNDKPISIELNRMKQQVMMINWVTTTEFTVSEK